LSINGASSRDTHYRLDGDVNNDGHTNDAPMQPVSIGAVQSSPSGRISTRPSSAARQPGCSC
jgi:hypothetical protein